MAARMFIGDVYDVLATMPDDSVDLVMTSPPFLALRSYLPADHPDKAKEIGSEATPADFLDTLLALTEEWGRVLAPHGSICVELGDTYAGSGGAGGDYGEGGIREGQQAWIPQRVRTAESASQNDSASGAATDVPSDSPRSSKPRTSSESRAGVDAKNRGNTSRGTGAGGGWPLAKSLTLIPTLYAASLAYGRNLLNPDHTFEPWRVRNLVAWVRPNPPVGALGDKVRPATSYLTWATRSRTRWFDLDAVRHAPSAKTQANLDAPNSQARTTARSGQLDNATEPDTIAYGINPAGAPPLDWWKISPGGYQGAHYATFPEELCRIPIEASCARRVCLTCGKPSRRELAKSERYAEIRDAVGDFNTHKTGTNERGTGNNGGSRSAQLGSLTAAEWDTTGWSTCGCPGTDGIRLDGYHTGTGWRPGHVLDPFGGSGTTAVVATGRGRDCTLIDIDDRNADLARERLGMFLTDVTVIRTDEAAA